MSDLESTQKDVESVREKIARFRAKAKEMQETRIEAAAMATPPDGIQCNRCGNTGYIMTIDSQGYETAVTCPDCFSRRQMARWLKHSGISPEDYDRYTLETFLPDTPEAAEMKQKAMEYLDQLPATGFGVFGSSGTGKTHICIAICHELSNRYREPHYYFSYRAVMPELIKASKSYEVDYEAAMHKWKTVKNLYIDDLFKLSGKVEDGVLTDINREELKIMYDILNARYVNHLRTLFSSEYSVKSISDIDGAVGSRIFEMTNPYGLKTEGKNRRLKKITA